VQTLLVAGALTGALCVSPFAHAGDLAHIDTLVQPDFHKLSEDLGAVAAYKGVTPATSLGITGFDVGVEVAASRLQNRGVLESAGAGSLTTVYVPKLHVHKGLPGGFDVGAFISKANAVNMTLLGVEARYALLDDTVTMPAVGLRLSASRASGVSQLDLSTYALDAVISKKLTVVTPFAGIGTVKVASSTGGLAKESFSKTRAFVGLGLNVALINVAVEAEKLGGVNTLSAKAGLRF
jgi:hypothetical protein